MIGPLVAVLLLACGRGASAFSPGAPPTRLGARSRTVRMAEMWGPEKVADVRIEGGKTLRTFQMPNHAERVQYVLSSPSGRPIKAKVELWIGPIRCTHEMIYDCMNGKDYPLKATLKFKKVRLRYVCVLLWHHLPRETCHRQCLVLLWHHLPRETRHWQCLRHRTATATVRSRPSPSPPPARSASQALPRPQDRDRRIRRVSHRGRRVRARRRGV